MKSTSLASVFLLSLCLSSVCAQDPQRFREEVDNLVNKYDSVDQKNLIVFTGSSSIRLWTDLEKRFPGKNVINTGFGGSHMSDMFYFADELIVRYKPTKVFIYEGDNDLGNGKSPEQIISDASKLIRFLTATLPKQTKIFLITPKPSILRWDKRKVYEEYIMMLKKWSASHQVTVIDVWNPMLDEKGELKTDLFIDDNLHMNSKGYDVWTPLIQKHLN